MVDIKEFSRTRFLNNVLAAIKVESANGFEASVDGVVANAVAPAECRGGRGSSRAIYSELSANE